MYVVKCEDDNERQICKANEIVPSCVKVLHQRFSGLKKVKENLHHSRSTDWKSNMVPDCKQKSYTLPFLMYFHNFSLCNSRSMVINFTCLGKGGGECSVS